MAAPSLKGFEKTYQDWSLICDNTGTCNMAGYPEYYSEHPVSILFTRSAGEKAPVTAQLALLREDVGNKTAEIILKWSITRYCSKYFRRWECKIK